MPRTALYLYNPAICCCALASAIDGKYHHIIIPLVQKLYYEILNLILSYNRETWSITSNIWNVSDGSREESTSRVLWITPALTHLYQFLTYCPMRLTVAPCSCDISSLILMPRRGTKLGLTFKKVC